MTKSPFKILPNTQQQPSAAPVAVALPIEKPTLAKEIGGQPGPEPTRFGDWEKAGRCTDF